MLKAVLTGGIASGKSYVLAKLRQQGVPTLDADDLVHGILEAGTKTSRAIGETFGSDFLKPDGSVDRARLGAMVFRDPERRRQLEALTHPVVYDAIRSWYLGLNGPVGMVSVPLLYETGRERDFDFVAVTYCTPEEQLKRLVLRDRMPEEQARRRIAAQLPAAEKASRADFVVDTGGSFESTDRQIESLLVAINNKLRDGG
jgi:dephospho-CoA kinase